MADIKNLWTEASSAVRASLIAGILVAVAATVGIGYWAMRSDYQVLFTDLQPRDAAAMAAELDRIKMPYKLSAGGAAILVPEEEVHKTRLKLMGANIPLQGAVGFELFNTVDFGMTDFVQKINFQRALQGELTRTILTIENVASARVHLALPESGLFKKSGQAAKASVKLEMKPGHAISPDQELGIRRLVAAAVPDIDPSNVVILGQNGAALTRQDDSADGPVASTRMLEIKKATEDYLTRKLMRVLDQTLGAGNATVSIDVIVDIDQNSVSMEEVIPAQGAASGAAPSGTIVRERQTSREGLDGQTGAKSPGANSSLATEVDYQTGRRVEKRVTAPGAVRKMTAAIAVSRALNSSEADRLRELAALAIGINRSRGDVLALHTLDTIGRPGSAVSTAAAVESSSTIAMDDGSGTRVSTNSVSRAEAGVWAVPGMVLIGVLILAWLLLRFMARHGTIQRKRLSVAEREHVLSTLREWMRADTGATR